MSHTHVVDRPVDFKSPRPRPKRPSTLHAERMRFFAGVMVTAGFALVIAVVLASALFIGIMAGTESSQARLPERVVLPEVDGAPEADLVLPVQARLITGTNSDFVAAGARPLGDDTTDAFVNGEATLVATIQTELGPSDLYRWVSITEEAGATEMYCTGVLEFGGVASCNDGQAGDIYPRLAWGSVSYDADNETVHHVALDNLPRDTVWVVVTTANGHQIAATSVERMGYLSWVSPKGDAGRPATAVALDADFNELWRRLM